MPSHECRLLPAPGTQEFHAGDRYLCPALDVASALGRPVLACCEKQSQNGWICAAVKGSSCACDCRSLALYLVSCPSVLAISELVGAPSW